MPLAWKTSDLKEIVTEVKKDDDTYYLSIVDVIKNMQSYEARDYLEKLPSLDKLSDAQMYALFAMSYSGGHPFNLYTYRSSKDSELSIRIHKICNSNRNRYHQNWCNLSKDDLKYVSQYYRNQWKKANGVSKRVTSGVAVNIEMNEFSLAMFKESINKPFNQTEAKNYVLSVNKAYDKAENSSNQKIRNKFYKLILDNTKIRSKVMINSMQPTELELYKTIGEETVTQYYNPDDDEVTTFKLNYATEELRAYSPAEANNTYSDDINIVPGNTNVPSRRDQLRYVSGASMLLHLYLKTNNETYKTQATSLLTVLDKEIQELVHTQIQAITLLDSTLKQGLEK